MEHDQDVFLPFARFSTDMFSCAAELLYAVDTQESEVEAIDNDDDPKGAQPVPFAVRLSTEHHDLCPWKGNSCPKEFLQLPPLAGEDWRRGKFDFCVVVVRVARATLVCSTMHGQSHIRTAELSVRCAVFFRPM